MNTPCEGILRITGCLSAFDMRCEWAKDEPFVDMYEEHSSGLFHGLDHDTEFGSHRGISLFKGVEV